ncbi:MAG: phosphatase PAP2 family protein [Candidatus Micrarchaeota archaeon]
MNVIEIALRSISVILEKDYYPIILLLTLLALAFSRNRRILILSFLVVIILTATLKTFYQEDRPCKILPALVDCTDYGFPSGHTITSILLPAATLGSFAFFMFLPLSVLIAFSRIYLGVHTLNQVVGGISLGLFVYFALERLHNQAEKYRQKKNRSLALLENGRQIIHILGGFAIIGMLYFFGLNQEGLLSVELILLALLISGMMLINMRMLGMWIGPFNHILAKFDRKNDIFPGRGPLMYLVGILMILSYSGNFNFMLGAIAMFAAGDGAATMIGMKWGKNRLIWNGKKSWEGAIAFFAAASIAAFPFIGLSALTYSAILAIIETLDFHIDDNLLIPFVSVIVHTFM